MNRSDFRRLARTVGALGAALALGCSLSAPVTASAADLPVVRFQDYPGFGNLLIRVARTKGWCQAAGIVCEMKPIRSAPLGLQALIGGSIDVAQTPISVVATAASRGAKVKTIVGSAVTNIFQVDVASALKLPHEAEGYPAVMQDLKGRKIGVVARGSATESFFSFLMEQAGLKADDVTYVSVGPPDTAFAALRGKQVDAIVSWEPSGTMCALTKLCKVIFRGANAPKPELLKAMYGAGIGLVMRSEEVKAHPEIAKAVVKISQQAAAFVNDRANEKEVLAISAEYAAFTMPHGDVVARKTFELGLDTGTFKTMVRRSAVEATLKYLSETKQLGKLPPMDAFVWKDAPTE